MADRLLYESKVPDNVRKNFIDNVIMYAQWLKIDPNWLMLVMNAESGLDPAAENPYTKATGLIQFMPATAKKLGYSVSAIKGMGYVTQLSLVEKYYEPYVGKMNSFYDLYLATFFPLAAGKPSSFIMQTDTLPASLIYKQNPAIAKYSATPGQITVADFKKYTDSKLDESTVKELTKTEKILKYLNASTALKVILIGVIPILIGIYLITYKKVNSLVVS